MGTVQQNINQIRLHRWQIEALQYFGDSNYNCIAECCTGSGKSLLGIECIKKVLKIQPNCRVLIVVPKNIILETGWYDMLYRNGFSLKDIGVYYGAIKEFSKITLTNMQNLKHLDMKGFDFICLDEIHNYASELLMQILNSREFPYKLGLTATLERLDTRHWELLKLFNYNLFKYSAKEALQDDVINSFFYTGISVEMDDETMEQYTTLSGNITSIIKSNHGYSHIMKENSQVKYRLLELMNKRKQMVNNYPRKFELSKILINKHKNDKIICFNQFNAQTNKFYWELLDIGVNARILHSGIPQKERDRAIIDYKNNKFNVLLTTKVADEGVNIPAIDVAIIFAADSTKKQTIQRLGRCLRKKDKISTIYVVYCKDTIEEKNNKKHEKLFTELATDYKFLNYTLDGRLF